MRYPLTNLNIYFAAAIELIPEGELMAMLADFGVNEKPSVQLFNQLMKEYGDKFMHPLAELALVHINTPRSAAKIQAAVSSLNKAAGKDQQKEELSEEQKAEKSKRAMGWFSAVSESILGLFGEASNFMKQINGNDNYQYLAAMQQANANAEKERTTRTIIWGVVGLIGAFLLFFVFYKMFQKH